MSIYNIEMLSMSTVKDQLIIGIADMDILVNTINFVKGTGN